jgi:FolB domain-containing protein
MIYFKEKHLISNNHLCKLEINDLRLWVHLGYSKQERYNPQCVSFDISITFFESLGAVFNDKLENGVCYKGIVDKVEETALEKDYDLIEHLSGSVYSVIKKHLEAKGYLKTFVSVKVTKTSPPVQNIHGGASFTYGDMTYALGNKLRT